MRMARGSLYLEYCVAFARQCSHKKSHYKSKGPLKQLLIKAVLFKSELGASLPVEMKHLLFESV